MVAQSLSSQMIDGVFPRRSKPVNLKFNDPPVKVCPSCYAAIMSASHFCIYCGSIQMCAVRRDDAKRTNSNGE